ncbi:MAG: alpha-galactosidase [Chloroflexi bacterium]|nr:alpha-galactosidase [Chloroflexota bacterium]
MPRQQHWQRMGSSQGKHTPSGTFLRRADVLSLGALLAAGCTVGRQGAVAAVAAPDEAGGEQHPAAAPPPAEGSSGFDQDVRIESGDAFIWYDALSRAWMLGNDYLEERIELQPVAGGKVHLERRYLFSRDRDVRADIAKLPDEAEDIQDALGIAIDEQIPDYVPVDQHLEKLSDGGLYLSLRFHDPPLGAEFVAEVRLRPGHAVVEHRSSIRNVGRQPLRLTRLDAADFIVRSAPGARWRAATFDNAGNVFFTRLGRDGVTEAETPAQSAARAPVIPLLILHDAAQEEGLFLGLRWTTNYVITARSLGDRRVAVAAGVRMLGDPEVDPRAAVRADQGFAVLPGQTITGPWLLLGMFNGSVEDGSSALKAYLTDDRPRDPGWASNVMPVAWNSWFAYGSGPDYQSMLEEARQAREMGIEAFYVDYGWSAAQGDWTPHPKRFPGRSLQRLADEVHRMRMRFGLWVAFGVADADSQLLRRHPDFRARQPAPARTGIDGSVPLCLTRAHQWLKGELARIVREYRLDWLKFDQPMLAACRDRSHGHDSSVRGSLHANNQAFYELLSGLRQQFPDLLIESTFDGAGYLDYGVFARSHMAWLDDAAGDPGVPMSVVQQSFYGASLAFPARFLTLWLARSLDGEGVEGRGLSPADLEYQGYSTMAGNWGISLRLRELDAAQRHTLRGLIEEYVSFRRLLPGAVIYHLLPPPTMAMSASRGPTVGDWFVLQYLQPDYRRGAILAVRNGGGPGRVTLKLRGLVPQVTYRTEWSDGRQVWENPGAALMDAGLPVELAPYSGGLLWLTPMA